VELQVLVDLVLPLEQEMQVQIQYFLQSHLLVVEVGVHYQEMLVEVMEVQVVEEV
jgi:hypothetical protein